MSEAPDYWGDGRLARITRGPWEGRTLLLVPDTAAEWWIGVIDPFPEPGQPGDFYADERDLPSRLTRDGGLQWLKSGESERAIEQDHFGWRPFTGRSWHGADASPEAIERMRSSLDVLGGTHFVLRDVVDVRSVTGATLVFGATLGLVNAPSGQELERYRASLGYAQDEIQLHFAAGDSESSLRAGVEASATGYDDHWTTFWFIVAVRLLLRRWASGNGDPLLDSAPVLDAWGDVGSTFWSTVRPRGVDAFFFGSGARHRFIGRAEAYIDRLSPPPSSVDSPSADS